MLMPERAGQLVQPERRPGRQLAEDDRLAQLLERVLGHRPVADLALGGRWRRRGIDADRPTPLIRCQTP